MDSKGLRLIKEAYGGIYTSKTEEVVEETVAEEQLDENPILDKLRSGLNKIGIKGTSPALEREKAADRETRRLGSNRMRQAEGDETRPTPMKDDVDIFDIVKGHLVSEGLTEEEAIKKMVTMTEEERNEILEGLTPDQESRRRDLAKALYKVGTPGHPKPGEDATIKMQKEYIGLQKLKGV